MVNTHESSEKPPRSARIRGVAVATICWSSELRKIATIIVMTRSLRWRGVTRAPNARVDDSGLVMLFCRRSGAVLRLPAAFTAINEVESLSFIPQDAQGHASHAK